MVMRIKELREQNNLSQKQLAINMGVIPTVVSNWESEVALPKTRDLPRLAQVLGCTIGELYDPDVLRVRDANVPFELLC